MFEGAHTALVTPFRDNRFDEAAFTRLIEFQIENGIGGVVLVVLLLVVQFLAMVW